MGVAPYIAGRSLWNQGRHFVGVYALSSRGNRTGQIEKTGYSSALEQEGDRNSASLSPAQDMARDSNRKHSEIVHLHSGA